MAKRPEIPSARVRTVSSALSHDGNADAVNAKVFQSAVLLHLDAAYTLARYLTRRADVAEDIVQEAMLRAYRGFGGHRGENVRAWLLAIVRNCFLTWHARENAERAASGGNGQPLSLVRESAADESIETETPETVLIKNDESRLLRSLVEELPHLFREVLVLRDIEDMSYKEIAEVTGVPIGTVMSRLARARKMLSAAWKGLELTPAKARTK
jgi:RNA polymerase sigma-70 factor (ECF subfamily)